MYNFKQLNWKQANGWNWLNCLKKSVNTIFILFIPILVIYLYTGTKFQRLCCQWIDFSLACPFLILQQ